MHSITGSDMKPNEVCVYAGTLDGLTLGHIGVIRYGLSLPFKKLVVAIGNNPDKKTLFTQSEREEMLRECIDGYFYTDKDRIQVDSFDNLYLVDYCAQVGAGFYLRGLRGEDDFRFESNMVRVNRKLENGHIQPVWFLTEDATSHISSSMAKALVGPKGWEKALLDYLPTPVYNKFLEKFKGIK